MARILVIDDDAGIRELLRLTLESHGHQVFLAVDGRKGVELFHRQPVDLVITDIIMPEMDGMEVTLEILNSHPETRIIAMSSGGRRLDAQYTLEMATTFGARMTVPKPFNPRQMVEAVRQVLEG